MKYCLLMIAFLITTSSVLAQERGNYYWYNGEKKYLDLKTDEHFILLDQFIDVNTLIAEFNIESDRIGEIEKANIGSYMVPRQLGIEFDNKDYHWLIISGEEKSINLDSPKISYHAPFFQSKSGERVGLSNLFYVRLHREEDIKILEELAERYHVDILGNNYYMPLWYTLTWNEEMGYGRVNAYRALIGTIENHGATLGIEKPLVTLPLYEDMDFHEDVYLASGSTLTIKARDNPVTLTANSGSVTIGAPAVGTSKGKPLAGGGDDSGDEDEIFAETPESITLSANYPNPFNPATIIRYKLPANSNVRLEVFDILGRRVAVLADGMMEAGVHEVTFDASHLASGVYLYRLQAGDVVQTRQMVLVK